jgi:hypothetical protein
MAELFGIDLTTIIGIIIITRSDGVGRVYMVYLYVEHPEDVFALKPQIAEDVFKRWDMERTQNKVDD